MSTWPLVVLSTGQTACFDEQGRACVCDGTGQDADIQAGVKPSPPRFRLEGELVHDKFTGLCWLRSGAISETPLMWQEALDFVTQMNTGAYLGYHDWRLPARAELLTLLSYQQTRPPLPVEHPFINIFPGWYWSATTCAYQPAHAWYLDLDGGRMFYGGKDQSFMIWPLRGESKIALKRQQHCHDSVGQPVRCSGTGQEGDHATTMALPYPRYREQQGVISDCWSGLQWHPCADLADGKVNWGEALQIINTLDGLAERPWRLPNINELESLVDLDHARPALSPDNPFRQLGSGYWSSTTSVYEPYWAWALYLEKGAIGVGQKRGRHFHLMAVR